MAEPTTTRIYNGLLSTAQANVSDTFRDATFLYLVAPDITEQFEIDCFLNIGVSIFNKRLIRLENLNVMNTELCTPIPLEYRFSGMDMNLVMYPSEGINLEAYAVSTGCCGQADLDDIKTRLTRIEGELLTKVALDVVRTVVPMIVGGVLTTLIGGVATQILPPAARGGFKILNPSTDDVFVNLGATVDNLSNYTNILSFPNNPYLELSGYTGAVAALSPGGDASLKISEF